MNKANALRTIEKERSIVEAQFDKASKEGDVRTASNYMTAYLALNKVYIDIYNLD